MSAFWASHGCTCTTGPFALLLLFFFSSFAFLLLFFGSSFVDSSTVLFAILTCVFCLRFSSHTPSVGPEHHEAAFLNLLDNRPTPDRKTRRNESRGVGDFDGDSQGIPAILALITGATDLAPIFRGESPGFLSESRGFERCREKLAVLHLLSSAAFLIFDYFFVCCDARP